MSDAIIMVLGQIERRLNILMQYVGKIEVEEAIQRMYADCSRAKLILQQKDNAEQKAS